LGPSVIVTWSAPTNTGGASVDSYIIKFRTSDGTTYVESEAACDGSNLLIVGQRTCTIPQAQFTTTPFNLAWGSSVYANVIAVNLAGSSVQSLNGNGATILTIPDSPTTPQNVPAQTSGT
jgi:hypothetical protein